MAMGRLPPDALEAGAGSMPVGSGPADGIGKGCEIKPALALSVLAQSRRLPNAVIVVLARVVVLPFATFKLHS
jgi:hypothetical protein